MSSETNSTNITKKIKVFCDGGARGNPGPAAIGVVVINNFGKEIYQISKSIGNTTNNVAEYQAVISALKWLKSISEKYDIELVEIFLDSKLIVNQLNGNYKIKNQKLQELVIQIRKLERKLGVNPKTENSNNLTIMGELQISYSYISRERNHEADALVNQALDSKLK